MTTDETPLRYVVDRETLIAAHEYQCWSSPEQMADMLMEGLGKVRAASPTPDAALDVEALAEALVRVFGATVLGVMPAERGVIPAERLMDEYDAILAARGQQ